MRRRLKSIGKWVSTVLAVLLLAIMVLGNWWQGFALVRLPSGGLVGAKTRGGIVQVTWFAPSWTFRPRCELDKAGQWWWVWRDLPDVYGHVHCGFLFDRRPAGWTYVAMTMLYPVLAATAAAGLFWRADRKARRRERAPSNACASCGYDRRGLARDVKCPECGALPTTPSAWPLAKTPDL